MIFRGGDSHYLVDLVVYLVHLLLGTFLSGFRFHFFGLEYTDSIGTFVLHIIFCVFTLFALAIGVTLGSVVVTLTVFFETI